MFTDWDIRREGRAWVDDEALARYDRAPEKSKMADGMLFWDEDQRMTMSALLLENLGVDKAVTLGSADVWKGAIADLSGRP